MSIYGHLEMKTSTKQIAQFSSDLMFEIESHNLNETFDLTVPLDFKRVEKIERYRKGNDLKIRIYVRLSFFYIAQTGNQQRPSYKTIMRKTREQFIDLIIPQSVWVNFLNDIGYDNIRILEISIPKKVSVEKTKKLFSYYRKARSHFINGDYEKTIADCRRVIEEVPILYKQQKEPTFKKRINNFVEESLNLKVHEKIARHIKESAISLWHFTSNFHHNPKYPHETIIIPKRADAEYILNQTLDLVVYLSKILGDI